MLQEADVEGGLIVALEPIVIQVELQPLARLPDVLVKNGLGSSRCHQVKERLNVSGGQMLDAAPITKHTKPVLLTI